MSQLRGGVAHLPGQSLKSLEELMRVSTAQLPHYHPHLIRSNGVTSTLVCGGRAVLRQESSESGPLKRTPNRTPWSTGHHSCPTSQLTVQGHAIAVDTSNNMSNLHPVRLSDLSISLHLRRNCILPARGTTNTWRGQNVQGREIGGGGMGKLPF